LQHDPDTAAQLDRALRWVMAEHGDLAAGAGAIALEDLHGGRLARAVGAEQAEHLAPLHGDVDATHRLVVAVALVQVANLDRNGLIAHSSDLLKIVAAAVRPTLLEWCGHAGGATAVAAGLLPVHAASERRHGDLLE
jgi:hypothetical protein